MLIAVPDNPDNPDDLVTSPQTGSSLDALLNYSLDFLSGHTSNVGSNGPWDWQLSNDELTPTGAPLSSSTVAAVRPDGSSGDAPALLIDNNSLVAGRRVGFYCLLDVAGLWEMSINLIMPDGAIITRTELVNVV